MFLLVRSKQFHRQYWDAGGTLFQGSVSFLGRLIPAGSQWLDDQASDSSERQENGDRDSVKMRGSPVFMEF